MSYRIKRVAQLTGINAATLRAWERRYGLLSPRRSAAGYRLYTDEDVATLARVKRLMDEGLAIGEAVERVRRHSAPLPAGADEDRLAAARAEILEGLLALDRPRAQAAWERVAGLPAPRQVDEALMPVLREVGCRWEAGETGVAEEHFATAFAREKLLAMVEARAGAASGPLAVLAGLPGERHEIGLLGAAVHLLDAGWRVIYLGLEVPLDELARVLEQRRPALLAISVLRPTEREEFQRVLAALGERTPAGMDVVVGGGGVPGAPLALPPGVRVLGHYRDIFRPAGSGPAG